MQPSLGAGGFPLIVDHSYSHAIKETLSSTAGFNEARTSVWTLALTGRVCGMGGPDTWYLPCFNPDRLFCHAIAGSGCRRYRAPTIARTCWWWLGTSPTSSTSSRCVAVCSLTRRATSNEEAEVAAGGEVVSE